MSASAVNAASTFSCNAVCSASTSAGSPSTVTANVFSTVVEGPSLVTTPMVAVSVTSWSAAVRVTVPV